MDIISTDIGFRMRFYNASVHPDTWLGRNLSLLYGVVTTMSAAVHGRITRVIGYARMIQVGARHERHV